jgi:hypothetical protein
MRKTDYSMPRTTTTRTKITAKQVCEACGNNEAKILGIAGGYFGIPHGQSWFIASSEIAKELNARRSFLPGRRRGRQNAFTDSPAN